MEIKTFYDTEDLKQMAERGDETLLAMHYEGEDSEPAKMTAELILQEWDEKSDCWEDDGRDSKEAYRDELERIAYVCPWDEYEATKEDYREIDESDLE